MDNHCIRVIHNAMNLDRVYVSTLVGVCSQGEVFLSFVKTKKSISKLSILEPVCEKFPDGIGLASYFFCPRSITIDFNWFVIHFNTQFNTQFPYFIISFFT